MDALKFIEFAERVEKFKKDFDEYCKRSDRFYKTGLIICFIALFLSLLPLIFNLLF